MCPSPLAITEFAPAKVNLYLHVVGRRADGYHLLDSLVVFPGVGDQIDAEPADDGLTLAIGGPFAAELPSDGSNLVLRAAVALDAAVPTADGRPRGARIRLTKCLPIASGIGGGSADAAATLRALARLWRTALAADAMAALALRLGADLPMCLAGRPAFIGGIGERLDAPPPLPPFWMVLVNPGEALATQQVFRARTGAFSPPGRFAAKPADAAALATLLAACDNDLAAPAIALCPVIAEVLAHLAAAPGTLLSRMSGSGATCFGLFGEAAAAAAAAARLQRQRPDWWIAAAPVAGCEDCV